MIYLKVYSWKTELAPVEGAKHFDAAKKKAEKLFRENHTARAVHVGLMSANGFSATHTFNGHTWITANVWYARKDRLSVFEAISQYKAAIRFTEDFTGEFTLKVEQKIAMEVCEFMQLTQHLYLPDADANTFPGHDFWFTRNGHGAGFWDGAYTHGDELTEIAKAFGECHLIDGELV